MVAAYEALQRAQACGTASAKCEVTLHLPTLSTFGDRVALLPDVGSPSISH